MGDARAWYRSTWALATLFGLLLFAAFPPLGWWPLAWIAPAGWIWLARLPQLPGRRPYWQLYAAGFIFCGAEYYWITLPHWSAKFGWLALVGYLAVYLPATVGLVRVAIHRWRCPVIVAAPVVWVGLEYVRAYLFTGFSMGLIGHTLYRQTILLQISDLGGAYAVSFVVIFVAACLARMIPLERGGRIAWWPLAPAAAILLATLSYGYIRMGQPPEGEPVARVGLIQGAIDTQFGGDQDEQLTTLARHYTNLAVKAATEHPDLDLLIWPESMFATDLVTFDEAATPDPSWSMGVEEFREKIATRQTNNLNDLKFVAQQVRLPMLLGIGARHYGAEGHEEHFNSAILVNASGQLVPSGRYDKMHGVIFGEYVPLGDVFPWLYDLTPMSGGMTEGQRPITIDVNGVGYAPNICFESTVPHLMRRQLAELRDRGEEPDVLVNLTNDGWFWGSAALDQHLACNVMRAIELRKGMLVAANTGFSASIDGDGRIAAQGPRRAAEVVVAEVYRDDRESFYARWGDALAMGCLAVCLGLAVTGLWQQRTKRRDGGSADADAETEA